VTIAACYVSPEGVVLGADSVSTYASPGGPHHFNYGQKLFEIADEPETGTLGIVTWGLAGLAFGSYRTMIAQLSDGLRSKPAASVKEVAARWVTQFWPSYSVSLAQDIAQFKLLAAKAPFDQSQPADPKRRKLHEELQYQRLRDGLVAGFCIGGYVPPNRTPAAFEIIFDPLHGQPVPVQLPPAQSLWGVPAIINRLIKGCGDEVRDALLATGKWNGTPEEMDAAIAPYRLAHPPSVPIREAIDFIHACLFTTEKALKFSPGPRMCGGPIEIAVITTDRKFRWVLHKDWDAAISDNG
jgi:hypothetical protein